MRTLVGWNETVSFQSLLGFRPALMPRAVGLGIKAAANRAVGCVGPGAAHCAAAGAVWDGFAGGWGGAPSRGYVAVASEWLYSFIRLVVAAAKCSSLLAAARPRRAKRRSPRRSFRCPLTGSTVAARRR